MTSIASLDWARAKAGTSRSSPFLGCTRLRNNTTGRKPIEGNRARKQPRDVEKTFLVAALELKLDLAKPHRRGTGVDRTHIERKFDDRAVALERKYCPAHARFELRFELATEFAGQQTIERGAARRSAKTTGALLPIA